MMLAAKWKELEVPDVEGITLASGERFTVDAAGLRPLSAPSETNGWLDVVVLDVADLFGGKYRVRCGEATAHGSIGVVVLEDAKTQEMVWCLVSEDSNPFDQIEIKGGYVVVLSTSSSVFRFRPELDYAALFIPGL